MHLALPTILTLVSAVIFLTLERVRPGRELPNSKGWYARAALINLCQVAITFGTNKLWVELFSGASFVKLAGLEHAGAGGLRRLAGRDLLLLLVAPHPPSRRLLAGLPPGPSLAGPHRGDHLLLQAPDRDPGRLGARGRDPLPASRRLA